MNINDIKRIIITQDVVKDENNIPILDKNGRSLIQNKEIYIFRNGKSPIKEEYDKDKHGEIFADYLELKGVDLGSPTALQDAEADGIFDRYDVTDIEKINEIENDYQNDLTAFP